MLAQERAYHSQLAAEWATQGCDGRLDATVKGGNMQKKEPQDAAMEGWEQAEQMVEVELSPAATEREWALLTVMDWKCKGESMLPLWGKEKEAV